MTAFPDWSYLGEETGRQAGAPGQPVWLVDPNDGTRDYLQGRRGSAVSIALVRERQPVLGVIFAFAYPDDAGDLFAWAEGCGPIRRNGVAVTGPPPEALGPLDEVLVSGSGDRDPEGNLSCTDPARFRSVPSIAHRLALVAAGEATAASALFAPRDWDYGAGHALLRAAGGALVDHEGREIVYAPDGTSRSEAVFGGSETAARLLSARPWSRAGHASTRTDRPTRLRRGEAVEDAGLLSRAQGCLLGQAAGDSLGALVEDAACAEEIPRRYPGGLRLLQDGGCWRLLAGQPTDDTEMALALARSLLERDGYSPEAAFEAYRRWIHSGPFDVGNTTRRGLQGSPDPESQANGSLMRASPLGIFAHRLPADRAAALARQDSEITHPHPVCGDSAAAFVVAIAHAIRTGDAAQAAYEAAVQWARSGAQPAVRAALEAAAAQPPACEGPHRGWVLIALQNAFHELLHAKSAEAAVVSTVARGGDTDTNAAIVGALVGAVHGRQAIPVQWRRLVLSCHSTGPRAERARPRIYWPADVYELAECLLLAGAAGS